MKIREQMPELTGATHWINGEVRKEHLIGSKPTLIHFWSVSCSLCKAAMPYVNQLRDRYEAGLHVVGVHTPLSKTDLNLIQIKDTARRHGISQPVFVDNQKILTKAFDNKYVPSYYLFDSQGRLRHIQVGRNGIKLLQKRIDRVLDR